MKHEVLQIVLVVSLATPYQRIDKEMKVYCEEPIMSTDTDPLSWWKLQQSRYPTLAVVAKRYLCICATSVQSE